MTTNDCTCSIGILISQVNETANQIQMAFIQRVMERDWLDEYTKNQCVDKVNSREIH